MTRPPVGSRLVPLLLGGLLALGVVAGCANGPGPSVTTSSAGLATPDRPAATLPVPPGGPTPVAGGHVSLEFDPASERALESEQVEWENQEPTQGQQPGRADGTDTEDVQVTDGVVGAPPAPPRGRVDTTGQVMLTRRGDELVFTDLAVDLDARRVSASLEGRRIDLLDLDTTRAHWDVEPHLLPAIVDVDASLSDDVRSAMRERLDADLPPDRSRLDVEIDVELSR